MVRATQAIRGRACPRCGSTVTKQHTNFGVPMAGRFQCFGCKRTWDEVPGHESYGDHVAHIVGPRKGAR